MIATRRTARSCPPVKPPQRDPTRREHRTESDLPFFVQPPPAGAASSRRRSRRFRYVRPARRAPALRHHPRHDRGAVADVATRSRPDSTCSVIPAGNDTFVFEPAGTTPPRAARRVGSSSLCIPCPHAERETMPAVRPCDLPRVEWHVDRSGPCLHDLRSQGLAGRRRRWCTGTWAHLRHVWRCRAQDVRPSRHGPARLLQRVRFGDDDRQVPPALTPWSTLSTSCEAAITACTSWTCSTEDSFAALVRPARQLRHRLGWCSVPMSAPRHCRSPCARAVVRGGLDPHVSRRHGRSRTTRARGLACARSGAAPRPCCEPGSAVACPRAAWCGARPPTAGSSAAGSARSGPTTGSSWTGAPPWTPSPGTRRWSEATNSATRPSDRGKRAHTGQHRRRTQRHDHRNRVIPTLIRTPVGHTGEPIQQVSIIDSDRRQIRCRARRSSGGALRSL
jgi:hypothetical protein